MKKKFLYSLLVVGLLAVNVLKAQDIHFSQYYNAPMLLNPANTALMPDNDFRVGANFRNQWASIPVPYNTFSAYADFKAAVNEGYNDKSSWLGIGAALFNDKAGNGNLSLTRVEAFLAYHLELGATSMLSFGLSGGYSQRSVDYNNLTFDTQWDGFSFNSSMANGERNYVMKTNFYDVGAGINYAYFPTDNTYIKIGAGVSNINQPKESFYGMNNQLAMRPFGNVDGLFRINATWIINPSVYYTLDKKASELVFGSLFRVYLTGHEQNSTQLILGAFHRLNESIIGAAGFQWGNLEFLSSYDATTSSLAPYNGTAGAIEFSIIYQGSYKGAGGRRMYNCPRFF